MISPHHTVPMKTRILFVVSLLAFAVTIGRAQTPTLSADLAGKVTVAARGGDAKAVAQAAADNPSLAPQIAEAASRANPAQAATLAAAVAKVVPGMAAQISAAVALTVPPATVAA